MEKDLDSKTKKSSYELDTTKLGDIEKLSKIREKLLSIYHELYEYRKTKKIESIWDKEVNDDEEDRIDASAYRLLYRNKDFLNQVFYVRLGDLKDALNEVSEYPNFKARVVVKFDIVVPQPVDVNYSKVKSYIMNNPDFVDSVYVKFGSFEMRYKINFNSIQANGKSIIENCIGTDESDSIYNRPSKIIPRKFVYQDDIKDISDLYNKPKKGLFVSNEYLAYDPKKIDDFMVQIPYMSLVHNGYINISGEENPSIEDFNNTRISNFLKVMNICIGKGLIYFDNSNDKSRVTDIVIDDEELEETDESLTTENEENNIEESKYDKLVNSGDIKSVSFFNNRIVNGAALVKLPDGNPGLAASLMVYDNERGKNIEITNMNGEHVNFLSEPELFQGEGSPSAVICSDDNNLYVANYNCDFPYVACYRMGDFKNIWKTSMPNSRLQSITVSGSDVIVFDMEDGKINYLDKNNGYINNDKSIDTKKDTDNLVHCNLAATNDYLFAANYNCKVFDNESGEEIVSKKVSDFGGFAEAITFDKTNNRIYMAFKDKVYSFDENGLIGYFESPYYSKILKLNFDEESGCLMVSSKPKLSTTGEVNIYNARALEELLSMSKELPNSFKRKFDSMIELFQEIKNYQEQNKNVL